MIRTVAGITKPPAGRDGASKSAAGPGVGSLVCVYANREHHAHGGDGAGPRCAVPSRRHLSHCRSGPESQPGRARRHDLDAGPGDRRTGCPGAGAVGLGLRPVVLDLATGHPGPESGSKHLCRSGATPQLIGTSAWAAGSRVVPSRHIAAARLIARANPSCLGFIALPSQPYCSTAPQRTTSGPPADLSRRGDPALGFGTDRFQRPDRVRNHRGHQRTARRVDQDGALGQHPVTVASP